MRTETAAADPAAVEAIAADILAHDDACVVKILSDDISHKSDVGGVRLAIKTPQEAAEAARDHARQGARGAAQGVDPRLHRPADDRCARTRTS